MPQIKILLSYLVFIIAFWKIVTFNLFSKRLFHIVMSQGDYRLQYMLPCSEIQKMHGFVINYYRCMVVYLFILKICMDLIL